MSQGQHRKPRTKTPRRLRRAVAGLSLAAAAATGGLLAADNLTTVSGDAAWGAPDTDPTIASGTGVDVGTQVTGDAGISVTGVVDVPVTPLDTAWG